MIFLKRFISFFCVLIIFDFMIFGMSFITHFILLFFLTLYLFVLDYFFSAKMRLIKYDSLSISYKKKTVLFTEIDNVTFYKFIRRGHIIIHNSAKKNYLTLNFLPKKKYLELKELILENLNLSKVRYKNRIVLQLFYPILFMLLFIGSFIIHLEIPIIDFKKKASIQYNIETNHYSFKIDDIKHKTMLSDSLFFLLTDKGKIYYKEFYDEGVSLRKFFDYPQLMEINDHSQIDYWFSNDLGVVKRMLRLFSISNLKPILFESEYFKGILLTEHKQLQSLRLKKIEQNGFLLIEFSERYSTEDIVKFLKTVSYN